MLQIYNSLTREKVPFKPLQDRKVRVYVCGMTVYDYCHIGHARVLVVFDVVTRYLRHLGHDVTYVRNITDIDDKIINRARENGESIKDLTERFTRAMHDDAADLGVLKPSKEPRATTSMDQIIAMISKLLDKGYAYQADNGDVYYDVSKFPEYGRLSGKKLEDLRAGERVAIDEAKDDPLDFVLWKAAKPDEPGEARWPAPWNGGREGRPGWHIECSAMATHCLGDSFDIHGGGMDLMFPHHENEIAQSEAATGKKFVTTWMHNGFVNIDNEKMSKSLGNFFTVREVLKKYHPEVVRFFILSSHYRSPLNYSDKSLDNAKAALDSFYTALRGVEIQEVAAGESEVIRRFNEAMDDDFNTPLAMSVLAEVRHELNMAKTANDQTKINECAALLKSLGDVLGLFQQNPESYLKGLRTVAGHRTLKWNSEDSGSDGLSENDVEVLINKRNEARRNRDWAESDRIRDELNAKGIVLEDGPDGTTWRRE